jgi:hypothetical protein
MLTAAGAYVRLQNGRLIARARSTRTRQAHSPHLLLLDLREPCMLLPLLRLLLELNCLKVNLVEVLDNLRHAQNSKIFEDAPHRTATAEKARVVQQTR